MVFSSLRHRLNVLGCTCSSGWNEHWQRQRVFSALIPESSMSSVFTDQSVMAKLTCNHFVLLFKDALLWNAISFCTNKIQSTQNWEIFTLLIDIINYPRIKVYLYILFLISQMLLPSPNRGKPNCISSFTLCQPKKYLRPLKRKLSASVFKALSCSFHI